MPIIKRPLSGNVPLPSGDNVETGYVLLRPVGMLVADVSSGSLVSSGVTRFEIEGGEIAGGDITAGMEYEVEIYDNAQALPIRFIAAIPLENSIGVSLEGEAITIAELYLSAYFRAEFPQYYLRRGDPLSLLSALGVTDGFVPVAQGGSIVWQAGGIGGGRYRQIIFVLDPDTNEIIIPTDENGNVGYILAELE